MELEMGILSLNKKHLGRGLVLAQGWPSWSYALQGLGFSSIFTYVEGLSLSAMAEVQATCIGKTIVKNDQLSSLLEDEEMCVFVQGSREFLETIYLRFFDSDEFTRKVIYVCEDIAKEFSYDAIPLTHSELGGVTSGSWQVYAPGTSLKVERNHVHRQLRHILSTVEGHSNRKTLAESDSSHVHHNTDLLLAGVERPIVQTKSVFDTTHDVTRVMTLGEMYDAYDIELEVQDQLKKFHLRDGSSSPSRAFVHAAPIKVLRAVAEALFEVVLCHNDNDALLAHISARRTESKTSCGEDSQTSKNNGGSKSAGPDRAAKPDDAEADPKEWDEWSVKNFVGHGKKALVCTGDYNEENHSRFFNAWRNFLHRRYRKNVTRSFIRFARDAHKPKGAGYRAASLTLTRSVLLEKATAIAAKCNASSELSDVSDSDCSGWVDFILGKDLESRSITYSPLIAQVNVKKRKKGSRGAGTNVNERQRNMEVGADAVMRAAHSSWWDWDAGSTLFFWRWPPEVRSAVRDGTKLFVDWSHMPSYLDSPRWPTDTAAKEKLKSKLSKVRDRGYIQPGFVRSLTGYFAVPKADTDIRVVYDATQCGLNDCLWTPNFFLPTVDSILRNASSSSWFGDIDLGEMFLNYALDLDLRPYAGVDVSELEAGTKRVLERWNRTLMGFKPSPYICTQTFAWSEEIILGDVSLRLYDDTTGRVNPFYWNEIVFNFPCSENYNPEMPWVYRWNSVDNIMPAFFGTYIDDIRTGADGELSCRETTHIVASRINYLGQQDASRKRGQPAKNPRAWAGAKCEAVQNDGVYVFATHAKWNKARDIIFKWKLKLGKLVSINASYDELEADVGFLVHMSRTYPKTFPYLKGFYNSLNGWRYDRNRDGWKMTEKAWLEMQAGNVAFDFESNKNVPLIEPTKRLVRGKALAFIRFGFGDASGGGFGSSWEFEGDIIYRYGVWGKEMDLSSSNLREFTNQVDSLETMGEQGLLDGVEVFFFTDNSTCEAAAYNGSSKSELLFELVLRLHKLEMKYRCRIHIIHCSGERMKAQGSDGLSRGNLTTGVMAGKKMIEFIPIHLTALERSSDLESWLRSWLPGEVEFLEAKDWFIRGHDIVPGGYSTNCDGMKIPTTKPGTFVWSPPPIIGDVAVEELRKARHKRQRSMHVFIIPRLMQPFWRKQLYKAADLVISLPPGHSAWPVNMFEPLTIGFLFPFLRHKPWQLRGCTRLLDLGRTLSEVWKENTGFEGPLLRELSFFHREVSALSRDLACKMLYSVRPGSVSSSESRKRRRSELEEGCPEGEILMKRPMVTDSLGDNSTMAYIRRVQLDAMWSRSASTVSNLRGNLVTGRQMDGELGLPPIVIPRGPLPMYDDCGFQICMQMLRYSQQPGRNVATHKQFDTVRRLRSSYTAAYASSPLFPWKDVKLQNEKGAMMHFYHAPSNSEFFSRFMMGMERRMGKQVRQNVGLSVEVLHAILDDYEEEFSSDKCSVSRKRDIVIFGSGFLILFTCALRGNELFFWERSEFCNRITQGLNRGDLSHFAIPLMGEFKNELGTRNHMMVVAQNTRSGLPVETWLTRLVQVLTSDGLSTTVGPAVCNKEGYVLCSADFNSELRDMLYRCAQQHPSLLDVNADLENDYRVYRSFRRGATTCARNNKVQEADIELHNRWRATEAKGGSLPSMSMHNLYTEISQALPTRLRFSASL
ncbi:hypothetical protein CTEN210_06373 [Chaetoceros tenuissimus]|uniref:Uncharacterized protein n=1 Tax=Chaetoceros tenuissimus TaxID=426638 RepID=A0AAD3CPX2_9STRA|nr:hypothetical protein CTEN210_06373 [Chaetoceros tenuissimus]